LRTATQSESVGVGASLTSVETCSVSSLLSVSFRALVQAEAAFVYTSPSTHRTTMSQAGRWLVAGAYGHQGQSAPKRARPAAATASSTPIDRRRFQARARNADGQSPMQRMLSSVALVRRRTSTNRTRRVVGYITARRQLDEMVPASRRTMPAPRHASVIDGASSRSIGFLRAAQASAAAGDNVMDDDDELETPPARNIVRRPFRRRVIAARSSKSTAGAGTLSTGFDGGMCTDTDDDDDELEAPWARGITPRSMRRRVSVGRTSSSVSALRNSSNGNDTDVDDECEKKKERKKERKGKGGRGRRRG